MINVQYLRLTTQDKEAPAHPDCVSRLPSPRTRVDFVHACSARCGEVDWVEFTDDGSHTGGAYGNCCEIVIPQALWKQWVAATNELTRAILQVRQENVVCTP